MLLGKCEKLLNALDNSENSLNIPTLSIREMTMDNSALENSLIVWNVLFTFGLATIKPPDKFSNSYARSTGLKEKS